MWRLFLSRIIETQRPSTPQVGRHMGGGEGDDGEDGGQQPANERTPTLSQVDRECALIR
jgi:hypothetical protein